jgi:hypothetical protein
MVQWTSGTNVSTALLKVKVFLLLGISLDVPTDGILALSWWWGLSAPETLRAMPAVA